MKGKKAKKQNLFVHLLEEYTARKSAYGFIWPLEDMKKIGSCTFKLECPTWKPKNEVTLPYVYVGNALT